MPSGGAVRWVLAAGGAAVSVGGLALWCRKRCQARKQAVKRGDDGQEQPRGADDGVITLGGEEWELGELLGRGSYGTVRRAHRKRQQRAVKMQPVATANVQSASRAVGFVHCHVVRTFGVFELGDKVVTVMECAGRPVAQLGEIAPGEIAKAMSSVAEALSYLHEMRLVHGDVTPKNMAFDGTTYRLLDCDNTLALDDLVLPTVSYPAIPQEVAEIMATAWETRQVVKVHPNCSWDVWMLGICAAHLIFQGWPDDMRELVDFIDKEWRHSAEAKEMAEESRLTVQQVVTLMYCDSLAAGGGLPSAPVEAPCRLRRALDACWAPPGERISARAFGAEIAQCSGAITVCRARCGAPLVPLPEE